MKIPIYQIDAFTNGPFTGNPAAVCPLDNWLDDEVMQNIALENNLSETAFYVPDDGHFRLRWFTPQVEVDLCGHATLATAFVLFEIRGNQDPYLHFETRSGLLTVKKNDQGMTMDFPADEIQQADPIPSIVNGLGVKPIECYKGRSDWMCVLSSEEQVRSLEPDFNILARAEGRGVLVTAPGDGQFDFVSRGFFPQTGVNEDPATGSAHTTLTPYWSQRLNKKSLNACQLSARMGFFHCQDEGDRVLLTGNARKYLVGEIYI